MPRNLFGDWISAPDGVKNLWSTPQSMAPGFDGTNTGNTLYPNNLLTNLNSGNFLTMFNPGRARQPATPTAAPTQQAPTPTPSVPPQVATQTMPTTNPTFDLKYLWRTPPDPGMVGSDPTMIWHPLEMKYVEDKAETAKKIKEALDNQRVGIDNTQFQIRLPNLSDPSQENRYLTGNDFPVWKWDAKTGMPYELPHY